MRLVNFSSGVRSTGAASSCALIPQAAAPGKPGMRLLSLLNMSLVACSRGGGTGESTVLSDSEE